MDNKRRVRRKDLTGQSFGNVKVVRFSHVDAGGNACWICRCKCGKEYIAIGNNLRRSAGIGCVDCKNEYQRAMKFKHGEADSRLHNIWMHMIDRCESSNHNDFKNYGGRGITVCDDWHEYVPFRDWAIANGYTDKLTIDRIDVNGNYEPSNCRWATKKVQANNKRNTKYYIIDGVSHTLSQWCDIYSIPYRLVELRLRRGIGLLSALTAPKQRPFGFISAQSTNPELLKEGEK